MDNRNIKDAVFTKTRALTSADGSVTSGDLDLENVTPGIALEGVELVIEVPALLAAELANADTLTIVVQGGASATPSTSLGMTTVITGDGNAVPAQTIRWRLPSTCPRYVNVKFTTAGTTGDMSDKTATVSLRF